MESLKETLNTAQQLYVNNPMGWNFALLAVMAGLCYAYAPWEKLDKQEWLTFTPHRRGKMLRRARRRFVEAQAIDDCVNAIEERVYAGVYTRDEAKELYRNLKKVWPVRDLFPCGEALKEAIRHRMEAKIHEPVKLPDTNKPKHAFDNPRLKKASA